MSLIELRSRHAVNVDENPRPEVALPKQDVAPRFGSTDKRTQQRPDLSASHPHGDKTSEESTGGRGQARTSPDPGLKTAVDRFVVEGAVPAEVTATAPIHRLPEVDGPAWVGGLVGLLGLR